MKIWADTKKVRRGIKSILLNGKTTLVQKESSIFFPEILRRKKLGTKKHVSLSNTEMLILFVNTLISSMLLN